jgi:hypothetical protein
MNFRILFFFLFVVLALSKTIPLDGVGTTLPQLNDNVKYRIFNDLFKQSTVFVPYKFMYGSFGRAWADKLNNTDELYPKNLSKLYAALSFINFTA